MVECFALGKEYAYGHTHKAFIFSLRNSQGPGPFKSKVKEPKQAIFKSLTNGPTFGGGHDIMIANEANNNYDSYTDLGHSYYLPTGVNDPHTTILTGSEHFSPTELEVFYLA